MSYDIVQTAVATVVKKITGYSASNVFEHDWRPLAQGQAFLVVLKPGPFSQQEPVLRGATIVNWVTNLELYVLNTGEQNTTIDTLITEREKLLTIFNQWPHLGGTSGVLDCLALSGGEVETIEGTQWCRQVLIVRTTEAQSFTRNE